MAPSLGFSRRRAFIAAACTVLVSASSLGFGQVASPGNSTAHVADVLQSFVDRREIGGAVVLIADRHQVLDAGAVGFADVAAKQPMRSDDVFWIASMSKAMTAAALMILVDEGKVRLDDPVENYLPEFHGQIMVDPKDPAQMTHPPLHPIIIREILCHTSGLPFQSKMEKLPLDQHPLREAVASYAQTPLVFEPGTDFLYSNAGINTAGRIIEVVSGEPYEDFLDQRLLKPLGMVDTTFWPTATQVARLPKSYEVNEKKGGLSEIPITQLTYPLTDRTHRFPMPAGGLFSTAIDVSKFCQMILNGGVTTDGRRLLSASAVKEMTTRQTPPTVKTPYAFGLDVGMGLFVHNGAYKTSMRMDPALGLVAVFMVQSAGKLPDDAEKRMTTAYMNAATAYIRGKSGVPARTTLRLPALFSDHLALQAEKPATFWGWALPGEWIEVAFSNEADATVTKSSARAGSDGRWSLTLPPLAAGAHGAIAITAGGEETQVIHDALVGEVWLGSGQSNMGYSINADNAPPEVLLTAKQEATEARGDIRYFAVTSPGAELPQADVKGKWVVVDSNSVGTCSAVAWNFGVILRQHLHRPVGLIVSAVGGTPAEAWIPKEALDATAVGPLIEKRNSDALAHTTPAANERYQTDLERWKHTYPTRELQATHRAPAEPYSANFRMVPCRLYNGKIHGLEPYTLKGILWFQADGNERHPEEYGELIKTLISTWRERWHDPLPFYYVEENNIHDYQTQAAEKTGLAFVRDAENAALDLPGVDVATSVDLGLGSDAHFPNKKEVGRRLAGLALNNLYGHPGLVHSPQFAACTMEGDRLRLRFKFGDGLRTRDGEPLRGFAIRDRSTTDWTWAEGKIEGHEIVLWSNKVPKPTAVRYAWGANPVLSVENEAGLPLRPFRTDADPIIPYPRPDWEQY